MMTKSVTNNLENRSGVYTSLIYISLLLTLCTVVLSAYIRLSQSGLNCSPWPDCYGQIGVQAEKQGITVLTKEGAEMSHKGARIAHRFIASSLGVTILLILLISIKRKFKGQPGLLAAILLMGTTIFLALLGYKTPSRTIPWVTLGNLGGGMFMLATLWWLGQSSLIPDRIKTNIATQTLAITATILLSLQILSGAWVSANFAATACNSKLLCDQLWPTAVDLKESFFLSRKLILDQQGSILLADQLAQTINMTHRYLSVACMLFLGFFAFKLMKVGGALTTTSKAIAVFLLIELLLGLISIYYQLPLVFVTAHNLVAALLLLSLVNALMYLCKERA